MENILIIYPHWVPSNLAGVHRARLIANFLPEFDVHPILLTVHSDYYEEKPDWDMLKTVNKQIEVIRVPARRVGKPRMIGDIGLRGFSQLKKKAVEIIGSRKIDFIWIPIPSFYVAVLGRLLYNKTGVPYGIDYIDPWIRDISNRRTVRAILSNMVARVLEPYSVRKASLISGVSRLYYQPVLDRNFKNKHIEHVAMPYGFDPNDHSISIDNLTYPWDEYDNCIPLLYAGAFLPKSDLFANLLFRAIHELKQEDKWNNRIKLFFVGTGNYSHKSIESFAKDNGVENEVIELRERFPFLHILNFLSVAHGLVILGSTESHYTASKTYQSLLSNKPVFSIMHSESSAVKVFVDCKADNYLCKYNANISEQLLFENIKQTFHNFIQSKNEYKPDLTKLDKYSAKESTRLLLYAIEKCNY